MKKQFGYEHPFKYYFSVITTKTKKKQLINFNLPMKIEFCEKSLFNDGGNNFRLITRIVENA